MSEELKSCPFCAGEADINKVYDTIYCVECGISFKVGREFPKTIELIAAWNCRPQPENSPLTLDEFSHECDLVRSDRKERWLWCVERAECGWYKVSELSKYANIANYGKTWLAYRSKLEVPNAD
jgi:hypothetical protein